MRHVIWIFLSAFAAAWPCVQAAPAPKPKDASPAVIDAGCEENIGTILMRVVDWADVGVREDAEVAGLDIVRRQKDRDAWLRKNLRVERVKGTNHVRVSFRDGSRDEQAAIVNAVVGYYLEKRVEEQRESWKLDLKRMRDGLEAGRRRGKLTAEQLGELESAITRHEERIRRLPSIVEYAKSR